MKQFIRQWLCEHKNTIWVSSKKTYVENLKSKTPKLIHAKEWYMCDDCKKFIKIDTGTLLN